MCLNGGTCINEVGSYRCECPPGFRGDNCAIDINECSETFGICQNGGQCFNSIGSYTCQCATGWTGQNCTEGSTNSSLLLGVWTFSCKKDGNCLFVSVKYKCIILLIFYRYYICIFLQLCYVSLTLVTRFTTYLWIIIFCFHVLSECLYWL